MGQTCRWAAILSDPALVSVVYIAGKIPWVRRLSQYLEGAMGPPFTNLFASCCTSPSFVFSARFATHRIALGPMCHLMCWLLSCGLCCFAVLADRWHVILGEFPGRCTQCNNLAFVRKGVQWIKSQFHWPKFHTTDCPQGTKDWQCRSFPASGSPKLEVCRNFPLMKLSPPKLSPDEAPPPPAPPLLYQMQA